MSSSVISANGEPAPGASTFLSNAVEDLGQLFAGLLHPQSHEPQLERLSKITTRITRPPTMVMCRLSRLALVKQDRELLLAEQLRDPAGRGDVAGGQRGQRGGVDVVGLPAARDELAVLVHEEHDLGVGLASQAIADRVDLVELLLVHHHLLVHRRSPLSGRRMSSRADSAERDPDSIRKSIELQGLRPARAPGALWRGGPRGGRRLRRCSSSRSRSVSPPPLAGEDQGGGATIAAMFAVGVGGRGRQVARQLRGRGAGHAGGQGSGVRDRAGRSGRGGGRRRDRGPAR